MPTVRQDGKPKRPMSAYMFFATEERSKVKKIQPTWNILEIAKELGQRWNALQPGGKARFEEKARKDKERYEREGGGRKERKGPKRPQSAYMFFVQDERVRLVKQHPTWTVPQVGSELGKRWRALNAGQKKKYETQAQGDKIRYQRETGAAVAAGASAAPVAGATAVASSNSSGSASASPAKSKSGSSKSSSAAASPSKKSKKSSSDQKSGSSSKKSSSKSDSKVKRVKKAKVAKTEA